MTWRKVCRSLVVLCAAPLLACGSVSSKTPDAGVAADASADAAIPEDAPATADAADTCAANEALSCANDTLVVCNSDGTGEESIACALGCHASEIRCNDVDPSNGLASLLDQTAGKPDINLGGTATIDTNTGEVKADGIVVTVTSSVTGSSPAVRVLVVGSLVAGDVTVTGSNALAIVSDGDIRISGHFSLSATQDVAGPGALNNATCEGKATVSGSQALSGAGGGGFGTAGGRGGSVTNTSNNSSAAGGNAGGVTGNATLTPLRGGCDSGIYSGTVRGHGGGAVQLVSRSKITVEGIVSANGSSYAGGGSGGGILLEAPLVTVSGNVVANGGAGAGGGFAPKAGENGRTDNQPAAGGSGVNATSCGNGGDGAAGAIGSKPGQDKTVDGLVFGGHGGGGAGRIRVNTAPAGLTSTGIVSPNASLGTLGTR